jgi:hypothetical protein
LAVISDNLDGLVNANPEGLESEDKAIALLTRLPRRHGAESRAANEVAKQVLCGRFRYAPGLGWLEWVNGTWDTDEVAKECVHEAIRLFLDRTERDYRAQAAEAHEQLKPRPMNS